MTANSELTTTTTTNTTTEIAPMTPLPPRFGRDLEEDSGRLECAGSRLSSALYHADRDPEEVQKAVDESAAYLLSKEYRDIIGRYQLGTSPATMGDRARLLAIPMSYPNITNKNDLSYYAQRLEDFVERNDWSVGVVELTIAKVEVTCKYPPSIAELVEVANWARDTVMEVHYAANRLLREHDSAVKQLKHFRETDSEWQAEQRQHRHPACLGDFGNDDTGDALRYYSMATEAECRDGLHGDGDVMPEPALPSLPAPELPSTPSPYDQQEAD